MSRTVEVVFTGGTIGSEVSGPALSASAGPPQVLLDLVRTEDVVLRTSEPFRILSEDASPDHWTLLARHLASLDYRDLDAVVVTHGSDTMAWTAKALAFALAGIPRPVVLVGSDKPLSDPSSNGRDNFRDAVSFALGESLPGVFVAWRNPSEDTSVHLASRILPCDPYDDRFLSARGLRLGTVVAGAFRRDTCPDNPTRGQLAGAARSELWESSRREALAGVRFSREVLVLPARPGADLSRVEPSRWQAILQSAHHSGTSSSQAGPGSLLDLLERSAASGTPVLLGPCRATHAAYESTLRLESAGIVRTPFMESTSLVVKLQWLLGRGSPLTDLGLDIAWEILP